MAGNIKITEPTNNYKRVSNTVIFDKEIDALHILKDHGYTQRQSSKMARTLGVENIGTDSNPKYQPKDAAAIVEELDKLQKKD